MLKITDVVIVPHNLTNKFQPLDLSVNKAAKSFIQSKYNDWFADQVFAQLQNGKGPSDCKISSKLSDLKLIHARWIVDSYNNVIKEKEMIVSGFNSVGISMKKLRIHFREWFFILVNLLVCFFFQNISFKGKTSCFFLAFTLTQISTSSFGTHVDKRFK